MQNSVASSYQIIFQSVSNEAINNVPTKKMMQHWITQVLSYFNYPPAEVCVRLVDKSEIQQLNQHYRGYDKPTNVLAFEASTLLSKNKNTSAKKYLGDVIICNSVVQEEAIQQGKSFEAHFAHLLIHGVLHLLGYTHDDDLNANEMESLEIQFLNQLGFDDPYREQIQ